YTVRFQDGLEGSSARPEMNPFGTPTVIFHWPGKAPLVLRSSHALVMVSPCEAHTISGRCGSVRIVRQLPPLPLHPPVKAGSLLICQLCPASELLQIPRS